MEEEKKEVSNDTKNKKETKPINIKFIAGIIVIMLAFVAFSNYKNEGQLNKFLGNTGNTEITAEEIGTLITDNLLSSGMVAEVSDITEENGLYRFKLVVSGQEYDSYMTKDKKIFFPEGISFEEAEQQKKESEEAAQQQLEEQKANIPKNEKPQVELFVMSECPYGTRAEKGIIPVVETLGDKIDFEIKFCDYAMHGEDELNEQMRQYCISQNENEKYISYLKCYLEDGDSERCLEATEIDQNKLSSCVSKTDNQYDIMENFADESTWKSGYYPLFPIFQEEVDKYEISGSPALVVNEMVISSGRDSNSLLEMICAGFEEQPEECNFDLGSDTPSAGFGYDTTTSSSSGSCG